MELIKQDPIIEATPYFELTHLETIPNKTLYH